MNAKLRNLFVLLMLFVLLAANSVPASAASSNAPLNGALTVAASVPSGVYYADSGIDVRLSATNNAFIVYTTDGSTPSASRVWLGVSISLKVQKGTQYLGPTPIRITGNKTIKVIALDRYNILAASSPVISFSYEVYSPTALKNAVAQKFSTFSYGSYAWEQFYTAQNRSKGSFTKTYTGITPGTVNCTWYTFVQVKNNLGREILFSTPGGLNGNAWYGKIVAGSNQVKYATLEDLIRANGNRPVYNVVVSFQRNGTGTAGHVLLIQAIINGVIYYSDNFKPGQLLTKNSVAEFKTAYSTSNGNIVGVVQMK